MRTPDLTPKEMLLDLDYVNRILGMKLSREEVKKLLEKMRFGVAIFKGDKISVSIPPYRADILSQIDLIEDIAIAYGYDKFQPVAPELSTYGKSDEFQDFSQQMRELAIGYGFQEVMTLILTNKDNLFKKMNVPGGKVTSTERAVSQEYSIARSWLLPSLMQVLEHNKNREYPQKIFEVGECLDGQGKTLSKFAGVLAQGKANFSEIKAVVAGIMDNLGLSPKIKELTHRTFIPGRCAQFDFGFWGEIHPLVLENFKLETPVTGFEFDLREIWTLRRN